ncbi:MAG: sorbosone dehydrogenase family protein [Acidobacteria bacterium]|nr:sorbosone dehydrogenase family protein [Acidobacteriota bacterium]
MAVAFLLIGVAAWLVWSERARMAPSMMPPPDKPFSDYRDQRPGTVHRITVQDLPQPFATDAVANAPRLISRPADAWPKAPQGFKVEQYAAKLSNPRLIRTAPNGDLFVAESEANRVHVFRGITKDGKYETDGIYATGLREPFGIAFYPPGTNPQYVYIANTDSVVRIPYQNGDMKARGTPETIVSNLPRGGHSTRNIAFSLDGKKMYIAVGSRSNADEQNEFHRANVLEANPDGSGLRVYASGIRNPVGIEVHPQTGEVWVSVNERDDLGDNLPPEYITHVKDGGFYGWPWYYIGAHQDPRHKGKHPELKDKVIVPDVLIQAHNASHGLTFYDGRQFPAEYSGHIFAAQHGSWNKAVRTGYDVIRVPLKDGHATGEYQDFLTGFVTPNGQVWGRPVAVAVASDGSLMVSDDGSESIWRVSYVGK